MNLLTRRRWIATGAVLTAALAAGGAALLSGSADATSTSTSGRGMGALVQSAPQRAQVPRRRASTYGTSTIPASVDLTTWAVPAGDQGPVGSCVSWTVGYSMSGWYAKKNGRLGAPYAPLFLYSQLVNGHGGPNVGTTFEANLNLEMSAGIDSRADYTQGDLNFTVLPTPAQKLNALHYRLAGWNTLYIGANQGAAGQDAIKASLANGDPVALGIDIYDNFLSLDAAHDHYGTIGGTLRGHHSVAVLGYDSYGVRVENSWGPRWGSNGFASLSWSFVDQHSDAAYNFTAFNAPQDFGPPPHLLLVTPASGAWQGGTTVTIRGTALTGASVFFGRTAATAVTVASDGTSLTAVAPAGLIGRSQVTVTTPAGPSNIALFTYTAVAPRITAVSPASGPTAGGNTVTITGANFSSPPGGVVAVRFASVPATSVTASSDGTSLTAVVPAGRAGPVNVIVVTTGGISAPVRYTYVPPPPPNVAVASDVTSVLRGQSAVISATVTDASSHGLPGTAVTLSGRPAGSTGTFVYLASASTGSNGVATFTRSLLASTEFKATAGTTISSAVSVAVIPPPTITALSSISGPALGGTNLTITGTLLTGATVKFGTLPATVVSVDGTGTHLVVTVPVGRRGPVAVVVMAPSGMSAPLIYTYTP